MFLPRDQMIAFGNTVKMLLLNARHRGSFSAIGDCFTDICKLFLNSMDTKLVQLCRQWLDVRKRRIATS